MASNTGGTNAGEGRNNGQAEDTSADAPLDFDAIRSTRTFARVLYSKAHAERTVPVNALTGERTRQIDGSVERAKAFVADDPHRVAVPQATEAMVESRSAPYVSTVFYDSKVVAGQITGTGEYGQPEHANDGHTLEWTYRAAVRSDAYNVELVETDYQTGNVTIHVERTEEVAR